MSSSIKSLSIVDERADLADMLKAIGHPVRLAIVRELAKRTSCCCGEMCDCFPLSQSTVSQHLSMMKEAGIVGCEKEGNRMRYWLKLEAFEALQEEFSELAARIEGCCHDR